MSHTALAIWWRLLHKTADGRRPAQHRTIRQVKTDSPTYRRLDFPRASGTSIVRTVRVVVCAIASAPRGALSVSFLRAGAPGAGDPAAAGDGGSGAAGNAGVTGAGSGAAAAGAVSARAAASTAFLAARRRSFRSSSCRAIRRA